MPRPNLRVPKYCHHKARNLARVTIEGKDIYLGTYDSPESHRRYDQVIAEWLLTREAPELAAVDSLTVCELMVCYLRFAKNHYVKAARPRRCKLLTLNGFPGHVVHSEVEAVHRAVPLTQKLASEKN